MRTLLLGLPLKQAEAILGEAGISPQVRPKGGAFIARTFLMRETSPFGRGGSAAALTERVLL